MDHLPHLLDLLNCCARGSSCYCARALGPITPCATSRPRTCGLMSRGATEPRAWHSTHGQWQPRPRRWAGCACSLPCALRRPQNGVPGRTRWAAPALNVGIRASTGARRRGHWPLGPLCGSRRWQLAAKRGLAGRPHLGSTPVHLPLSLACPGSRAWRLRITRLRTHCYCPSRARRPPRGSLPYPQTGPGRCRPRSCKSHFADASVCLDGHGCRRWLDPWCDHALARELAYCRGERSWSSEPGLQFIVGAEGHVVPHQ